MTIRIDGTNTAANPGITGSDTDTGLQFGTDEVNIVTGGTTRTTVDSGGRLLVGNSSSRGVGTAVNFPIQTEADYGGISVVSNRNDSDSSYVVLGKTRGTTAGSNTAVQNNDDIGRIVFAAADGTDVRSRCAEITASIDGTPGSNDTPGRITFSTSADGSSSPTERLRISSNGNIEASGQVQLTDGTAASPGLTFSSDGGADTGIFRPGANILGFTTGGTERMKIASNGYVEIGQVGSPSGAINSTGFRFNEGSGFWWSTTGQNSYWNVNTQTYFNFRYNANNSGAIVISNGSTSYNTSSDYRLKENVVDLDGAITRVKQLAPKRFNFIATPELTVDGFLAHEAQAIVPEAVTGIKDEVEVWTVDDELPDGVLVGDNKLDEDGNTIPKYQGIDQAKLVPLLTAALQEAIAKIETLETANASQAATIAAFEARLTALEGGN